MYVRNKKECVKCQKQVSLSNYQRHINTCKGKVEKKTLWTCEYCSKHFDTAQGYVGHKSRTHNTEQQRKNGAKGNAKKRLMEASGHAFSFKHSDETKEKLSIIACQRLYKHSKYTKNVEYKPGIILESSYEVRVAEILDSLGVEWIKVRQGYIWDDNGKKRRYIPDFYLPKQNIFLDPKNDYLIKKDKMKIESAMKLNNIKVAVLSDKMITVEFLELLLL